MIIEDDKTLEKVHVIMQIYDWAFIEEIHEELTIAIKIFKKLEGLK